MNHEKKLYNDPVMLVGGGDVSVDMLNKGRALVKTIIAADGGANGLIDFGIVPDLIIGDMDSVHDLENIPSLKISEQDTTDFEKCLYSIEAPLIIGAGFLGRRIDHTLAVLNALVRNHNRNIILVGTHDVIFAAPKSLKLNLPIGTRFSLFPLNPIKGVSSEGLEWPIDAINFAPNGIIGTSNRTSAEKVMLEFDQAGMLVMLPSGMLDAIPAKPLTPTNS